MPKAVLLDLENNMPTAQLLRDIIEHYPTVYMFNCQNQFDYPLEDLTEFSTWLQSGQVVILELPEQEQLEFSYAMLVGQLMALLEVDTHVELISAMPSSQLLLELMRSSHIDCNLIQIKSKTEHVPDLQTIQRKPSLQLVKKYCDALAKMKGKPSNLATLKNSVGNILQVVPEQAQRIVAMLINLKIVKRYEEQIGFRKKILKQWIQLDLQDSSPSVDSTQAALAQLRATPEVKQVDSEASSLQQVQHRLFKNFAKIDPVHLQVLKKLHAYPTQRPKDLYELRDFLAEQFPESDIRLLLKELLEKGYIHWNGHEVEYSHEMHLN